jgi:hypothetical protein
MEEYIQIENYENYFVSNKGNVKNNKTNKILKPQLMKIGYYRVSLSKNGKVKQYYIHRLVYSAFNNNNLDDSILDHIDRNKLNNNLQNLRRVSYVENSYNINKRNNTTSNFRCVSWCNTKQKWRCAFVVNNKQINKYFDDEIECAKHYNYLVSTNHLQEYCPLNVIQE